ncbi:MAG: DMT family transporter [Clostridiales bacterium]|nr:DMT family transporter [Clostridiales bacterium]
MASTQMYVFAMVIFGTLAPFVRNIGVSSGELALYRAVMGAGLIGIYLLAKGKNPFSGGLKREILLLLLSGGAMGINWILLFQAYRYTSVSTATLCYYFAPVIVTALSPVLFRERLTRKQLFCFAMATLGLVLITGLEPSAGSTNLTGILFGLGAAVFYAAVILLNKYIRSTAGIQRTFLQFLAAIVTLIPYVAATGGVTLSRLDSTGWMCLLVVGILHTGITYCLYFSSLKALPGQRAAILSYIDPLVAVLISVVVLREPMTWQQALGGGLILGFTLWNALPEREKAPS